jgi:hypothetical protein
MTNWGGVEDLVRMTSTNVVLDMYGVRFVVIEGLEDQASAPGTFNDELLWRLVGREDSAAVYENSRALPLAWLVPKWTHVDDDQALARVRGEEGAEVFDPTKEALVADGPSGRSDGLDSGRVKSRWNGEGSLTAEIHSRDGGLVVFGVNSVRGWNATIDGKATNSTRANFSLIGVRVPPGDHVVGLRFEPEGTLWRVIALALGVAGLATIAMVSLPAVDDDVRDPARIAA